MVATTVTGMGDGLLAEYVLDGCLAYLRGVRIGQPMSTQIVRPAATIANTARRTVSTAPNRVVSVLPTRSSRAIRNCGNVTLIAMAKPPTMYAQTNLTPCLRADDHENAGGEEEQHDVDRE